VLDDRSAVDRARASVKGQLLIALYSIRSDWQFCEQLDYNILFRWFLDMGLESDGLDQSNFSRLRERLVATDIARRFFDEVVRAARGQRLLSSDHFTVDGTLIEAWASFKSFKRKDGELPTPGSEGSGMVDFKGQAKTQMAAFSSGAAYNLLQIAKLTQRETTI
jgi:hypothetical protein